MPPTGERQAGNSWLYVQIFAGSTGREDWVVTDVVGPALEWLDPTAGRWFFLRYFDERGPHVRLRVRLALEPGLVFQRRLDQHLQRVLPRCQSLPAPPLKRLVRTPPYLAPTGRHVGFNYAVYEPEVDKYGGRHGVACAEGMFQTSSEVAVELLRAGIGDAVDRAGLSIHLMECLVRGCLPEDRREPFWRSYVDHWSGGATARGRDVRRRVGAALDTRGAVLSESAERWRATDVAIDAGKRLQAGMSMALEASLRSPGSPSAEELMLQHLHLTNNRLGVIPVEEALFGSVAWRLPAPAAARASAGRQPTARARS